MRWIFLALLLIARPCSLWSQSVPEVNTREHMQTKDGFSAELCLTWNYSIFEEISPNLQHLEPVKTVRRGVPFYTVILFANAANSDGCPDLTYDIVIRRPDGLIYGSARDTPGWRRQSPAIAGLIHVASGTLKIKIDPEDPEGTYTVDAEVRDNVRKIAIKCQESFVVTK